MLKKPTNNQYLILSLITIFLVGFLSYSNSLLGEFIFDDLSSIVNNPVIKNLGDVFAVFNLSPNRFITNLSFTLNYHFFGLNVFFYHLFNVFIHIFTAFSVFWFLRLLTERSRFIPFIASLVFVSHPIQTQAVSYIVQRASLQAALFYLLSLIFYIKSFKFTPFVFLSFLFAAMALFAKENAFTLPLAIILVDYYFIQGRFNHKSKKRFYLVPFFLIAIVAYVLIRTDIVDFETTNITNIITLPSAVQTADFTRQDYLLTQINVVRTYIRLLFFPINQNLDYDYPISRSFFELPTLLSFIFILSILIFALYIYKKNRLVSFGILFFFLTLSIESTVIPIADVIFEHRLYLPSVGMVITLASFLSSFYIYVKSKLVKHKPYLNKLFFISFYLLICLIIFFLSISTYTRNRVWRSRYTIWSDVVKKSPNKARGHYNLGVVFLSQENFNQAKLEFEKGIALEPKYFTAYLNLGKFYEEQQNYLQAEKIYLHARQIDSSDVDVSNSLGSYYAKQNRFDDAIAEYRFVLNTNPENASIYNNLAVVYTQLGRFEEAIILFEKAISLKPDYENAFLNLAVAHYRLNNLDLAISIYKKAIKLNPANAKAYYNIGVIYDQKNDIKNAQIYYQKSLEINPDIGKISQVQD